MDLHHLLKHFDRRDRLLTVPDGGHARQRFHEAKLAVLALIELKGSPYIDHICSECTYIQDDPDVEGGGLGK